MIGDKCTCEDSLSKEVMVQKRYIGSDGISWSIVNVHLLIACPRAIPSIRDYVGLLGIRDNFSCRWGTRDYCRKSFEILGGRS